MQNDYSVLSDSSNLTISMYTVAPSDAGEYICSIVLTDPYSGCSNSTTLPLSVKSPLANLGSDLTVAIGTVAQLGIGDADPK